jgi:hypothetical protein
MLVGARESWVTRPALIDSPPVDEQRQKNHRRINRLSKSGRLLLSVGDNFDVRKLPKQALSI